MKNTKPLYIGIVGSRDFPQLRKISALVRAIAEKYPYCIIVSGRGPGVDTEAETTAHALGLETCIFPPEAEPYPTFRERALARNTKIAEQSDVVVAFQWHNSPGTSDTVRKARKLGKKVFVYGPDSHF